MQQALQVQCCCKYYKHINLMGLMQSNPSKKEENIKLKKRTGQRAFSSEENMKDMKRKNSYPQGAFLNERHEIQRGQFMKIPPHVQNLHLSVSRVRVIKFDSNQFKYLVFSRNGRQARYEHIKIQDNIGSIYKPNCGKTDLAYFACSWYMKENKLVPYQFIEYLNLNRKSPDITKMASLLQKVDPGNKFGITSRPFSFSSKKIIEFSSKQRHIFLPQNQVQKIVKIPTQLEKNPELQMASNQQYKVIKHLNFQLEESVFDALYKKEEQLNRQQIDDTGRQNDDKKKLYKFWSSKPPPSLFSSSDQKQRHRQLLYPSYAHKCQEGKIVKQLMLEMIAQFKRDFDQIIQSSQLGLGDHQEVIEAKQAMVEKIHEAFKKKTMIFDRKNGQNEFIIKGPPLSLERMNNFLAQLARDYRLKSIRLQLYPNSLRGGGLKQIQTYILKIQQNYNFILEEMDQQIKTKIKNQKSLQEYRDIEDQFKSIFSRKINEYEDKNRSVRSFKQSIQLAIVMDVTASMSNCFQTAKQQCTQLINSCRSINPDQIKVKIGCVFYKDYDLYPLTKKIDLTEDTNKINQSISEVKCETTFGRDTAEAVIEGLEAAAGLSWTSGTETKKYVYLICDAPPHGKRFGNTEKTDKYLDKNEDVTIGSTFKQKRLNISVISVGNLYNTIPEFKKIFGEQFLQNEDSSPQAVIKSVEAKMKSEINRFIQIGKELERVFASKKQIINKTIMVQCIKKLDKQISKEKAEKLMVKGKKIAKKFVDQFKELKQDSD